MYEKVTPTPKSWIFSDMLQFEFYVGRMKRNN